MNRQRVLKSLQASAPVIMPSMLQCDFSNLEAEVRKLETAGITAFHLDVMDGMFVPNITYGLPIVKAFRKLTSLPIDVHLMIERPEEYLTQFRDAGADIITFHIEAIDDPEPILHDLEKLDVGIGLAANPNTPVSRLEPYLSLCDIALIMSVEAGFGGQSFNPNALEKLQELKQQCGDELLLQVDGGVNEKTIADCVASGADLLVVGSAIFNHEDYVGILEKLSHLAIA